MRVKIQINFAVPSDATEQYLLDVESMKTEINSEINSVLESLYKNNLVDNTLKKIIITDQYQKEVNEQAEKWNRSVRLTREKEYSGVSKTLFNYDKENPEVYVFIPIQLITIENQLKVTLYTNLFWAYAPNILPDSLKPYHTFELKNNGFAEELNYLIVIWLQQMYVKQMVMVYTASTSDLKEDDILSNFFRKVKRELFKYNNDSEEHRIRLSECWTKIFSGFGNMIQRLIEIKYSKGYLNFTNKKYEESISKIIAPIEAIFNRKSDETVIPSQKTIKSQVLHFFKELNIHISEVGNGISLEFDKNPKEYFKNELVDTEPRIVCFLDILGFKEMIEEYDNDEYSTVLQDIQEALNLSLSELKKKNTKSHSNNDYLEYRIFSDCISISAPYFETKHDFLTNFNYVSTFVRIFQYQMMIKGFFVRGGISTGSFYSNEYMIFSKGLVNAYYLEKDVAVYPRVVIDKLIIEKLKSFELNDLNDLNIDAYLINCEDNHVILNPIITSEESFSLISKMQNKLNLNPNDEFDNFLGKILDITLWFTKEKNKISGSSEASIIDIIKIHIEDNIEKHQNCESVQKKYIWLRELIIWIQTEKSDLNFNFLFR